jgi:hypothetical protein
MGGLLILRLTTIVLIVVVDLEAVVDQSCTFSDRVSQVPPVYVVHIIHDLPIMPAPQDRTVSLMTESSYIQLQLQPIATANILKRCLRQSKTTQSDLGFVM